MSGEQLLLLAFEMSLFARDLARAGIQRIILNGTKPALTENCSDSPSCRFPCQNDCDERPGSVAFFHSVPAGTSVPDALRDQRQQFFPSIDVDFAPVGVQLRCRHWNDRSTDHLIVKCIVGTAILLAP
jgi:hypothetical protein